MSAQPDTTQGSQVSVVVAWELSWYRYRVDLGDEADPVMMLDKGEEIEQIDEDLREWNARLDADGRVLAGHSATMEVPKNDLLRRAPGRSPDELYDKLADYYKDDPNVEVIVDRRAQGGLPGDHPSFKREAAPARQGQLPDDRVAARRA